MEFEDYNSIWYKNFKFNYLENRFWNSPFEESNAIWSSGNGNHTTYSMYNKMYWDVNLIFIL